MPKPSDLLQGTLDLLIRIAAPCHVRTTWRTAGAGRRCSLGAEHLYFDSAGVRLHYIVEGKGEPVVLIHGYGGSIDAGWTDAGIVKGLSDRYQVIAFDMRGHGRSDKPRTPEAYGLPMVEDVIRLMDRLKIERAHIVGYSMGGRIAITLLADHPERVRTAAIGGAGW